MNTFSKNNDGWFEANLGYSATDLVHRLRKARRNNKDEKEFIDKAIEDIRAMKSMELDATLKMHSWCEGYSDVIKELGMSDNNMKALRKFGDSRKVSLQRACHQWQKADEALKMLEEYEDVWQDEQKKAWVCGS